MRKLLRPIKIKIFYDDRLQRITGKSFEEAIVSKNLTFVQFLNFIFSSYPEIHQKFHPGTLGFLLNDRPPTEDEVLKNNDEVKFMSDVSFIQD
ncbi:MAG: MoaD/ThiS family protein [Patescibacteria group bacterium]